MLPGPRTPRLTPRPRRWLRRAVLVLPLLWLGACGMGSDSQGLPTNGVPRCDPALLHPKITVAATSVLPGQLIVYVDGVMACIDDSSKVDALLTQISAREAQAQELAQRPPPR